MSANQNFCQPLSLAIFAQNMYHFKDHIQLENTSDNMSKICGTRLHSLYNVYRHFLIACYFFSAACLIRLLFYGTFLRVENWQQQKSKVSREQDNLSKRTTINLFCIFSLINQAKEVSNLDNYMQTFVLVKSEQTITKIFIKLTNILIFSEFQFSNYM